jgi:membrane-associated phospholipid phosphatase
MAHAAARTVDTLLLRRLRTEHSQSRRVAAWISEAAESGRAWLVLSGLGALSPRTRRAAIHGAVAWGAGSAMAFGLKAVTNRPRPRLWASGPTPRSSSMPSSHTAGAVAYAVAATLQSPATGTVTVPLAAAVGWSRTATARHFPTDVAVGAGLGAVVGLGVHFAGRPRHRPGSPPSERDADVEGGH